MKIDIDGTKFVKAYLRSSFDASLNPEQAGLLLRRLAGRLDIDLDRSTDQALEELRVEGYFGDKNETDDRSN